MRSTLAKTVTTEEIIEKERSGKFHDVGDQAVWCLSSCKSNHGISELLDGSLDTFWQSDGPQPHTVTIQFPRKTVISEICLYNDFKIDESYTPSRIAIRVGNHIGDLVELREVDLHEPVGWTVVEMCWPNGSPVSLFTLQLRILTNHQNGRDTHLRALRLLAPPPPPSAPAAGLEAALATLSAPLPPRTSVAGIAGGRTRGSANGGRFGACSVFNVRGFTTIR